jgi:hypothetical protein
MMKTMTLEQLKRASAAGSVAGATLTAQGSVFNLRIRTSGQGDGRFAETRDTASAHVDNSTAAHDEWFRAEVEAALVEADDPATVWISNDEANERAEGLRASLLARITAP